MTAAYCNLGGEWRGTAEVYGGDGRFLGNGIDRRSVVTDLGEDRTRIELSFTGPFSFAGHYVIEHRGKHRHYTGPANYGLAEALDEHVIQADNYWAAVGMSQRFFLMKLPGGERQLSLAILSHGERVAYYVVGENHRVPAACGDDAPAAPEPVIDPAATPLLLHRAGRWTGKLALTDARLEPAGEVAYEEMIEPADGALRVHVSGGGWGMEPATAELASDGAHAWTRPGALVGSYSLIGGRALSGHLHHMASGLRVWRREVVAHDASYKAIVHNVYRGHERIGVQHGVLRFEAAA